MKFRRNKKGFTMVELIIVIAVIAVLTAILVPTFIHLASKAGDASDKTIVKNANTQLAMKQAQEGRNFSMSKAVADVDEIGYHIPGVTTSNGNKILWDSTTDRFVLVNKSGDTLLEDSPRSSNNLDLFCAYKNMDERGEDPYSFYAKSTYDGPASVSITSAMGFDAGDAATDAITAISYAPGENDENTVTIATNAVETELTINAPKGGVIHDGVLGVETVTKIKDGSMHEHGKVGFAEMVAGNTGRFVAEKGCNIKALWFSDAGAKYEKLSGAKVEEYASSDEIKTEIEKQLVNDEVIFSNKSKEDVKQEAIEELDNEVNPEPAPAHDLTPEDKAAQAQGKQVCIDGEYYTNTEMYTDHYFFNGGTHTIKLIDTIVSGTDGALGLFAGAKVELDLNGYSFLLRDAMHLVNAMPGVFPDPELTIKDSSGDSGVWGIKDDFDNLGYGLIGVDAKLTILGGTFRATGTGADVIGVMGGNAKVYIGGGRFIADENACCFQKPNTLSITGGTFDATASGSTVFGFKESEKSIDYSKATIVQGSTIYRAE